MLASKWTKRIPKGSRTPFLVCMICAAIFLSIGLDAGSDRSRIGGSENRTAVSSHEPKFTSSVEHTRLRRHTPHQSPEKSTIYQPGTKFDQKIPKQTSGSSSTSRLTGAGTGWAGGAVSEAIIWSLTYTINVERRVQEHLFTESRQRRQTLGRWCGAARTGLLSSTLLFCVLPFPLKRGQGFREVQQTDEANGRDHRRTQNSASWMSMRVSFNEYIRALRNGPIWCSRYGRGWRLSCLTAISANAAKAAFWLPSES